MAAAYFDLERTISREAVEMVAAKALRRRGLGTWSQMARVAWIYVKYEIGLVKDFAVLKREGARLWRGRELAADIETYEEIYESHLADTIFPQARRRIEQFQEDGTEVVIVSATYKHMIEPFARELGVRELVGQEIELVDGVGTGNLAGPVWHGENKARFVREHAEQKGHDLAECWAFGDSWNDVHMLAAVGHPVAVNPDRKLRARSQQLGWEVVTWE